VGSTSSTLCWFNKVWSRDNANPPQIVEPKIDTVLLPVRFQWWMMSATTASFQVIAELLCISFFNCRTRLNLNFRFARDPFTPQFDALAFATGERAQRLTPLERAMAHRSANSSCFITFHFYVLSLE
jgi:hypothetical protein